MVIFVGEKVMGHLSGYRIGTVRLQMMTFSYGRALLSDSERNSLPVFQICAAGCQLPP